MRHQPDTAFTLDISRLGRRPGDLIAVDETIVSPSRIGLDLLAIEAGAPLHLDLQLQSLSDGVLVTGTVSAPTVGQCARCLSPISGDVNVRFTEMFADPDAVSEADTDDDDDDDEVGHIVDDKVDIEQTIVDAVGLELPLSPVCSDDCPGLCPECGVALATAEEGHGHDVIDPRWAKLAELKVADPQQDSQ